jgi:hypothetical protein
MTVAAWLESLGLDKYVEVFSNGSEMTSLAKSFGAFREGFETADLVAAGRLLREQRDQRTSLLPMGD